MSFYTLACEINHYCGIIQNISIHIRQTISLSGNWVWSPEYGSEVLNFAFWNEKSWPNVCLLIYFCIPCNGFSKNTLTNFNFNTMKELVAKINAEIAEFQKNAEAQVEKGNKAAGARARKNALELMKDLKEFRKVSVEASK